MLLGYIWLLGTFVNSSCDIKINVNIVQNCCRNLAVRGLKMKDRLQLSITTDLKQRTTTDFKLSTKSKIVSIVVSIITI